MKSRYAFFVSVPLAIVAIIFSSSRFLMPAQSQFPSGIYGRVTTSDGAVVVGAEVRITNVKDKRVSKVVTDTKGEYSIELGSGSYDLSVDWPSWKSAKRKNIKVETNGKSVVDFVLQPGKPVVMDADHP
jgi:hypothetical protein